MPFPINVYRGVKIGLTESIPTHRPPLKRVIIVLPKASYTSAPRPKHPTANPVGPYPVSRRTILQFVFPPWQIMPLTPHAGGGSFNSFIVYYINRFLNRYHPVAGCRRAAAFEA